MVHPSQQRQPQPRYEPKLSVTFSRQGRTRSVSVRPWAALSALAVTGVLATTVVGAAAFLIFRDDLVGAAISRQVEMQYAYEERIAALRSELDRVTSRHVVQSEGIEQQLSTLLTRQDLIESRQAALDSLVEKARASGITVAAADPRLPRPRPDARDDVSDPGVPQVAPLGYMPGQPRADHAIVSTLLKGGASGHSAGLRTTFSRVEGSLDEAQTRQGRALEALSASVENEAERISSALVPIGIEAEGTKEKEAEPQGGPFIPVGALHFVERAAVLDRLLDDIGDMRRSAAVMPLAAPLSTQHLSSRFGYRIDPFQKKRAFHSGLDFVAAAGTTARATAPGVVTIAGWNEGYGNMVEIRHANGVSTRYGHLSQTLVTRGQKVDTGTPIGRVGSTGRSTGPHLHYETRRNGEAVNPAIFFAAARALKGT